MFTRACLVLVLSVLCIAASPGFAAASEGSATQSTVVAATPEQIWPLFSTTEGVRSWVAPMVEVDFRVGGAWRTNYNPDGELGDATTITNTILAYEPNRMIAMKTTGFPENFPWTNELRDAWSVIRFEPIDDERTRLSITAFGIGDDAGSKAAMSYFDRANQSLLDVIAKRFIDDTDLVRRGHATLELLQQTTGHWICEWTTDDGMNITVYNGVRRGADDESVVTNAWFDFGGTILDHGWTLAYREPASRINRDDVGAVRFHNVSETGEVATGSIIASGTDRDLTWNWTTHHADGSTTVYIITQSCDFENDRYTMKARLADGSALDDMPDELVFRRIDAMPERFAKAAKAQLVRDDDASASND
ncbi:MAG: SRPBCC domain-containing protein [Planctomycetota bacterium]